MSEKPNQTLKDENICNPSSLEELWGRLTNIRESEILGLFLSLHNLTVEWETTKVGTETHYWARENEITKNGLENLKLLVKEKVLTKSSKFEYFYFKKVDPSIFTNFINNAKTEILQSLIKKGYLTEDTLFKYTTNPNFVDFVKRAKLESLEYFINKGFLTKDNFIKLIGLKFVIGDKDNCFIRLVEIVSIQTLKLLIEKGYLTKGTLFMYARNSNFVDFLDNSSKPETLEYFINEGFLNKDNFIDLVTKTEFSDLVRRGSIEVFDLSVQKKLFDKNNDWPKLVKSQNFIRLLNDGHNAECFKFFIDNKLLTTNNFIEVVTDSNFLALITYMNDSDECNKKRLTVLRLLVEGEPLLTADNLIELIEENCLRFLLTEGDEGVVNKIRNYSGGIKEWLKMENKKIEKWLKNGK